MAGGWVVVRAAGVLFLVLVAAVAWHGLGSRAGGVIVVPDDYPTIQAAVDAAGDGWTILVRSGVYRESVVIEGKSLSIEAYDGPVVVEAQEGDAFTVRDSYVALVGLNITCNAAYAVRAAGSGLLKLVGVSVSPECQGGVYVDGPSLNVTSSVLEAPLVMYSGERADVASSLLAGGLVHLNASTVVLADVTIAGGGELAAVVEGAVAVVQGVTLSPGDGEAALAVSGSRSALLDGLDARGSAVRVYVSSDSGLARAYNVRLEGGGPEERGVLGVGGSSAVLANATLRYVDASVAGSTEAYALNLSLANASLGLSSQGRALLGNATYTGQVDVVVSALGEARVEGLRPLEPAGLTLRVWGAGGAVLVDSTLSAAPARPGSAPVTVQSNVEVVLANLTLHSREEPSEDLLLAGAAPPQPSLTARVSLYNVTADGGVVVAASHGSVELRHVYPQKLVVLARDGSSVFAVDVCAERQVYSSPGGSSLEAGNLCGGVIVVDGFDSAHLAAVQASRLHAFRAGSVVLYNSTLSTWRGAAVNATLSVVEVRVSTITAPTAVLVGGRAEVALEGVECNCTTLLAGTPGENVEARLVAASSNITILAPSGGPGLLVNATAGSSVYLGLRNCRVYGEAYVEGGLDRLDVNGTVLAGRLDALAGTALVDGSLVGGVLNVTAGELRVSSATLGQGGVLEAHVYAAEISGLRAPSGDRVAPGLVLYVLSGGEAALSESTLAPGVLVRLEPNSTFTASSLKAGFLQVEALGPGARVALDDAELGGALLVYGAPGTAVRLELVRVRIGAWLDALPLWGGGAPVLLVNASESYVQGHPLLVNPEGHVEGVGEVVYTMARGASAVIEPAGGLKEGTRVLLAFNSTLNVYLNLYDGLAAAFSYSNLTLTRSTIGEGSALLLYRSNATLYLNSILDPAGVEAHGSRLALNSPGPLAYEYAGAVHEGFLGNYWGHAAPDADGDGVGDEPLRLGGLVDCYPLTGEPGNYRVLGEAGWVVRLANETATVRGYLAVEALAPGNLTVQVDGYTINTRVSKGVTRIPLPPTLGPGAYNVTLTLHACHGASYTAEATLAVEAPQQPPGGGASTTTTTTQPPPGATAATTNTGTATHATTTQGYAATTSPWRPTATGTTQTPAPEGGPSWSVNLTSAEGILAVLFVSAVFAAGSYLTLRRP